jgi:DNA-binding transcriptional MerR regulator
VRRLPGRAGQVTCLSLCAETWPPPGRRPVIGMASDAPGLLLTVGIVARRSGLTAKALRHYDRIGLLPPAHVDHATGYRRYDRDQVAQAWLVHLLRSLDLPLDEVRVAVAAWTDGDAAAIDGVIRRGRRRPDARITRLRGALHRIDHLLAEGIEATMSELSSGARMIHTAHASRCHWGQVPTATPAHLARGEWQISRVYTVLSRAEPALHHARRVLDICREHDIGDWDLAFAYEALARAHAVAGDAGQAREYTDQALAAAEDIAEDEERELVLADLETIPGQPRYW